MPNKQVLIDVLNHKKTDQVPWVPFSGVHSGKLVGYNAREVLTDGDKLFEALMEVHKIYKPHGQPVTFDLQLEAEALGCELVWADYAPPSVSTHPLEEDPTVPSDDQIPDENSGRIPMVLDVTKRFSEEVGDDTLIYGVICGPFTLAAHLRGNDLFMDMYDDEEYVHELMDFCRKVAEKMSIMFIDAGADVLAVTDPLVSQISSDHFEEFVSEPYKKVFNTIRDKDAFSSFFVCGDATRNIEVMCQTDPDSISIDENIDLVEAKKISDKYNIAIGGNIPLTTVMLHGNQLDNMKFVVELIESLDNTDNFILAPGCDMPYDTPIENTIGVSQAVLEPAKTAEMLENYVAEEADEIEIELPDYDNLDKPLVEVFTLDSETCAACTYMYGAAVAMKDEYGDKIDMFEYKYTIKEDIARIKKVGVEKLPSIYINGELKFSSIVPSSEEFKEAIEAVI